MRYVLKLEAIGDNVTYEASMCRKHGVPYRARRSIDIPRRPWVARITGYNSRFGLHREFLTGQRDYTRANGPGSRGIFLYYFLDDGLYEVNELVTWSRTRRYFLRVERGQAEEITTQEAAETCLLI